MKKKIGIILIVVAVLIITFSFMRVYSWPIDNCCTCSSDSWFPGSGILVEISKIQQKYQGVSACNCEIFGCIISYRIIPIDYLLISAGMIWYGIKLIKKKKLKQENGVKDKETKPKEK